MHDQGPVKISRRRGGRHVGTTCFGNLQASFPCSGDSKLQLLCSFRSHTDRKKKLESLFILRLYCERNDIHGPFTYNKNKYAQDNAPCWSKILQALILTGPRYSSYSPKLINILIGRNDECGSIALKITY